MYLKVIVGKFALKIDVIESFSRQMDVFSCNVILGLINLIKTHGLDAPSLHELKQRAALLVHLLGVEERLRE